MNPVVLVVFILFCIFVFSLVVRAFIVKYTHEEKPSAVKGPVATFNFQSPLPKHDHEWRNITEFVRRCAICGEVEIASTIPEGMEDYVRLMTTRKAKEDPKGEASHYPDMDSRAKGFRCPNCERMIGDPESLPKNPFTHEIVNGAGYCCPYCQEIIVYRFETKEWKKK